LVDQRIKNTLFLSPGKLSHRRQHFSAKEPGSDYLVVANMYMTHEKMKEHSTMMFHEDVMVPNCNEITVVPIEKKGNFYPTRVSIGMTPPVAFRQSVEVKDETDISLISLLLPNSESYYSLISCPKYGVLYALDGGRKKKIDRTGRLISNKLKYRTVGDPKEDAFAFIVTSNGIESNEAVVRILLPSKPNH
jgi:hypothetical protein